MTNHIHNRRPGRLRQRIAFTLVEMTIVILVIAIMGLLALPVFVTAYNQSKAHRTRAMIAKIDQIIGEKWEAYRTRQVPIKINPLTNPNVAAGIRVNAIRELQRFELPDRVSDVANGPAYPPGAVAPNIIIPSPSYPVVPLAALPARPAVNKQYLRYATQAHDNLGNYGIEYWSTANENAECLYLILAVSRDGDNKALDWFSPSEIGDTDGDGMNEILDGWGQPIAFLRWPAGYGDRPGADGQWGFSGTDDDNDGIVDNATEAGYGDDPVKPATPQSVAVPDPFDPFKIDSRWSDNIQTNNPFALKPLIWSSGPDKIHNVNVNTPTLPVTNPAPTPYAFSTPPNDPYFSDNTGLPVVGMVSGSGAADNITNHDLEAR